MTHTYPHRASPWRVLRIIAAVMAAMMLGSFLLCTGGVVLLLWGAQQAVVSAVDEMAEAARQQEVEAVQTVALTFLQKVTAGDLASAANASSRALQARQTIPQWREWQTGLSKQASRKLSAADLQISAIDSAAATNCRVIVVAAGGFDVGAVLDLVKEDGRWTVDRVVVR